MKRNRTAFTLIEILVVVAIIAIVAGIIFPVLARAKVRATMPDEVAHMKQVFVGIILYESDESERDPDWLTEVEPYVKDTRLFASRRDVHRVPLSDGTWPSTPLDMQPQPSQSYKVSYTYIKPLFTDDLTFASYRAKPEVGMLLSIWMGDPVGPVWPDLAPPCPPIASTMGPPLQGPVLRINMDGSLYELPQHPGGDPATVLPLMSMFVIQK